MDLDMEARFKQAVKKISEIGEEYAKAKAESWRSQELKGSILSSIIKRMGDLPLSKSELLAKDSDDYKKYLSETSDAIYKELSLKAKYESWKCHFESLRSLSSLEKSTRNLDQH